MTTSWWNSPWTPERDAVLVQKWNTGLTAREIALLLWEGCNRNQVLGRGRRLGLPPLQRPKREVKEEKPQKPPKPPKIVKKPPDSFREPVGCRYMLNDDTRSPHWCDAARLEGIAWCEAHARIVYRSEE